MPASRTTWRSSPRDPGVQDARDEPARATDDDASWLDRRGRAGAPGRLGRARRPGPPRSRRVPDRCRGSRHRSRRCRVSPVRRTLRGTAQESYGAAAGQRPRGDVAQVRAHVHVDAGAGADRPATPQPAQRGERGRRHSAELARSEADGQSRRGLGVDVGVEPKQARPSRCRVLNRATCVAVECDELCQFVGRLDRQPAQGRTGCRSATAARRSSSVLPIPSKVVCPSARPASTALAHSPDDTTLPPQPRARRAAGHRGEVVCLE